MAFQKETIDKERKLFDEFVKTLETTTEQVILLLTDINNSKVELAEIKTELKFLIDNVKELSSIIKDSSNGKSVLTRIVLIEMEINQIKDYIAKTSINNIDVTSRIKKTEDKLSEVKKAINLHKLQEEKKADALNKKTTEKADALILKASEKANELRIISESGKWKLYVILATGTLGIIGTIITLLIKLIGQ